MPTFARVFRICTFFWLLIAVDSVLHAQDLVTLLQHLQTVQDKNEKIQWLKKTGFAYQQQQAYKKAIEYFKQAETLETELGHAGLSTLEALAASHEQLGEYTPAMQYYVRLQSLTPPESQAAVLKKLLDLHARAGDWPQAVSLASQLVARSQTSGQALEMAAAHNQLGYVYSQAGDQPAALRAMQEAIKQYNTLRHEQPAQAAFALTNIGAVHSYLQDFKTAEDYFRQALELHEDRANAKGIASVQNYLAANDFAAGNTEQALTQVQQAIEIAEAEQAEDILQTSYLILAEVYQRENDLAQYRKYARLHDELNAKNRQQANKRRQQLLEIQAEAERKENELRQSIADRERQNMAYRQLELEREKQQKDLTLLQQEQNLKEAELRNQQLEKQRVQQLLQITRQQAEAEKQRQAIALLEKDKEVQQLQLRQKEAEEKEQQQAIALLEKDKRMQEQQLRDATLLQQSNTRIFWLLGLVIILIVAGLLFTAFSYRNLTKKNEEIRQQREEIIVQNEELQQSQEEVIAQRDAIAQKNKALDQQNSQISKSIQAARLIQQAMLPHQRKLQLLLPEHFVLYRPRDVVSGDFYWVNEVEGKIFVAVMDCTGHGVPGAFMSMIGTSLLDKIVRLRKILSPAQILDTLDHDIQQALNQAETRDENGMDACLVCLNPVQQGSRQLIFAGAKRPLYMLAPQSEEIISIKGSRKYIGSLNVGADAEFSDHVQEVPEGTMLYLSTDGITDQNNVERQRFGDTRLRQAFLRLRSLPMPAQQQALEAEVLAFMEEAPQRDDMLLMAVKC